MAPGTFGAARLDFSRISRADFLSNTINGFRPPQQDGPRRLLPGASKLPRLHSVKRMRRNGRTDDDRAWSAVQTADGWILADVVVATEPALTPWMQDRSPLGDPAGISAKPP